MGSTVYLGDSRQCAYAEVLTGFRQKRASIARAAESVGWQTEEYIDAVFAEAKANGVDAPWAVSVDWQMERSICEIRMPANGWWVRMDHADTLSALQTLAPTLPGMTETLQVLTAGTITGDDRPVTTLLAEVVRQQILDDGSEALGLSFQSKTLLGRCWAYWDRRADKGLAPSSNSLHQIASQNVGPDPAFNLVADRYKLPILGPHAK